MFFLSKLISTGVPFHLSNFYGRIQIVSFSRICFIFIGREEIPEDILSKDQIELVAEKLGEDWKRLGTELNFPEDDMSYFETENNEQVACAKKMLTIWQVNILKI